MKILILTRNGDGLGLAHRLAQEGHEIQVYSTKVRLEKHKGIFEISENLWKSIKDVRFVIADEPGWPRLQKKLNEYNRPIIGSNEILELANVDIVKQFDLFHKTGIPTPITKVFDDAGDIYTGMLDWTAPRTIIRYGEKTIFCDYKEWLSWGVNKVPLGQKILFQEMVQGVDILITGWFDGLQWMNSFSVSPDLQTENYAMVSPIDQDSMLVQETIVKLTPILKKLDYHGPVHLQMVVNKSSIFVQNLLIGFVYPLAYATLEFIRRPLGEFLAGVAFSNPLDPNPTKDFVGVVQGKCVGDGLEGAPILGVNPERLKHLVFHNVAKENGDYTIALSNSSIFTATAHGPTISDTASRVYQTAENIRFPEKHYDSTLSGVVTSTFSKLKQWKYL